MPEHSSIAMSLYRGDSIIHQTISFLLGNYKYLQSVDEAGSRSKGWQQDRAKDGKDGSRSKGWQQEQG